MNPFSNIDERTALLENSVAVNLISDVLQQTDLKDYVCDKVLKKYAKEHFRSRWTVTILKNEDTHIRLSEKSVEEQRELYSAFSKFKSHVECPLKIFQVKDYKGRTYTLGDEPLPGLKIGLMYIDDRGLGTRLVIRLDGGSSIRWTDVQRLRKEMKRERKK